MQLLPCTFVLRIWVKLSDPIWMPHDWPCTKLERACIRFLVRTKPLSHLFTISVVSPTTILCCCATSCRCYCCVVGIRVWISIARSCPRLLVAHNLPSLRLDKNTQSIGGVKFYAAVLSKPIKFTLLDKLHVIDASRNNSWSSRLGGTSLIASLET